MCEYRHTKDGQTTKAVAGLKFRYKTKICQDCGAALWGEEHDAKFRKWLLEQARNHEFKIQKFKVNSELDAFIESIAGQYLRKKSEVCRAMLALYLKGFMKHEDERRKIDRLYQDKMIAGDAIIVGGLRVSPLIFVEIEDLAVGLGLSMAEATTEIINRTAFALKAKLSGNDELEMVLAAA